MGVRIQELPETTGINKEDVLIVEDGQGTKKGTVQQLDEALGVSQLKEDLVGIAKEHKNLLAYVIKTPGYRYNSASGGRTADSNYNIYDSVQIKSGETYYYYDVTGFFSYIVYENGTTQKISTTTESGSTGNFVANDNGRVLITVNVNATDVIFTNSKYVYDNKVHTNVLLQNKLVLNDTTFNEINNKTQKAFNLRKVITVGKNGTEDFSKIIDAVDFAFKNGNIEIQVHKGTYDIIDEYGSEDAMLATGTGANRGMRIGNNTKIVFEPFTKVLCNYTGTNETIKEMFSVFNAWTGDVEIEGLNVECSNIRYCIHDEMSANFNYYHHMYKNCIMNNKINFGEYQQCIGGGLGTNGYIEIYGGIYKTQGNISISYHNHGKNPSLSKICISDVYCENNTIRFYHYGSSTDKTPCIVSNSHVNSPIIATDGTVENMEVFAWNNEISS